MPDVERLNLVVFDMDGTLIDSQAMIVAAMDAAWQSEGLAPPPRVATLSIVGLSLPQAMARLAPEQPPARQDRLVAAYKAAFTALRATELAPLYPGARAALDVLAGRADTVLGIATGKSRRGLDHVLDAHGLRDRFVTLQVADDHPSKPDPSMLRAALRDTGAGRAVMVGDTTFDMDMAANAGLPGLGVAWGYHPAQALTASGAVRVLARFDDLPAAVDALWVPA
jgi:phosphoglycolate phosphatase